MRYCKTIFVMGLAALTLSACKKDEQSADQRVPIEINNVISSVDTKVHWDADGSGSFVTGDVIGLYAAVNNAQKLNNTEYKVGVTTLYWDDISTNKDVTFAAYYPKTETIADATAYSFDPTVAENPDLLVAVPVTAKFDYYNRPTINLQFKHILHKLVVNVAAGEGFTENDIKAASVTLTGLKPTAVVDILAGSVSTSSTQSAKDVANTESSLSRVFYVAPQALNAAGSAMLYFDVKFSETDTRRYTFSTPSTLSDNMTALTALESGKSLTINLTLSKSKITVNSLTIEPWIEQGTVNGKPTLNLP